MQVVEFFTARFFCGLREQQRVSGIRCKVVFGDRDIFLSGNRFKVLHQLVPVFGRVVQGGHGLTLGRRFRMNLDEAPVDF